MLHHYSGHTLAEIERQYILDTVAQCGGNRTAAARLLDISVRGLRHKLNRYSQEGHLLPDTRIQCGLHRANAAIENDPGLLWG